MEKRILVVDSPTSTNINYFERTFANSSYDCRIVTSTERLTPLIDNLRFLYIFIGDVADISWIQTYKYNGMAYIVLYSSNIELVEKQSNYGYECSVIPMRQMNRFLTEMNITASTPLSVDPSLLF